MHKIPPKKELCVAAENQDCTETPGGSGREGNKLSQLCHQTPEGERLRTSAYRKHG